MTINNAGLRALTTSKERAELRAVGTRREPVKLQYLKRSKQCGLRLWNVLSPVTGYITGPLVGYPTFSLETLKQKGLI